VHAAEGAPSSHQPAAALVLVNQGMRALSLPLIKIKQRKQKQKGKQREVI